MSDLEAVVTRVAGSRRYRAVDATLVRRLAGEELPHARNVDDAARRVRRRLHQAVGAFARGSASLGPVVDAWTGDPADPAFRAASARVMASHASTAERAPYLDRFFDPIWTAAGGAPASLLDLGCGLGPLALPWMGLDRSAPITAVDVDGQALATVDAFLGLVGQPHRIEERDLADATVGSPADVALLLKLVTTLDRQDAAAAARRARQPPGEARGRQLHAALARWPRTRDGADVSRPHGSPRGGCRRVRGQRGIGPERARLRRHPCPWLSRSSRGARHGRCRHSCRTPPAPGCGR